MQTTLVLDQPDLLAVGRSRRIQFGAGAGERILVLNGRGRSFEGGTETPDLSLRWRTSGSTDYVVRNARHRLVGDAQLLLNRGEPYRLRFREESESFRFSTQANSPTRRAIVSGAPSLPEFPTLTAHSPKGLQDQLQGLKRESRRETPDGDALVEHSLALLTEMADLARTRRKLADRVPAFAAQPGTSFFGGSRGHRAIFAHQGRARPLPVPPRQRSVSSALSLAKRRLRTLQAYGSTKPAPRCCSSLLDRSGRAQRGIWAPKFVRSRLLQALRCGA
jgi:hypothetical protein